MRSWNARGVTRPCFWLPRGCNCACMCVFFFLHQTMRWLVFRSSTHARLFKSVAACVQRHMCGIFQAATARLSCQIGPCALAFPLNASTLSGPVLRLWEDGRGRGPRKPRCQRLPLGERAICTSILTGFTGK